MVLFGCVIHVEGNNDIRGKEAVLIKISLDSAGSKLNLVDSTTNNMGKFN